MNKLLLLLVLSVTATIALVKAASPDTPEAIVAAMDNDGQCSTCLPYVIKSILAVKGLNGGQENVNKELVKKVDALEKTVAHLSAEIISIKAKCCRKH